MMLKFGNACRSGGEVLGTLWGLCIEPREKLLLRAIVEQPQAEPLIRVKVPFGRIDNSDDSQTVLGVKPSEMDGLPRHDAAAATEGSRRSRRRRRGDEIVERVLSPKTSIECRDGEVGRLRSVTVDARSGDLEEVAFDIGSTLEREVVVGVAKIDELGDDRILLDLDKDELAAFTGHRA